MRCSCAVVFKNVHINRNFYDPQSAACHLIGFYTFTSSGAHEPVFKTTYLRHGEFADRPISRRTQNPSQPIRSLTLLIDFSEGRYEPIVATGTMLEIAQAVNKLEFTTVVCVALSSTFFFSLFFRLLIAVHLPTFSTFSVVKLR